MNCPYCQTPMDIVNGYEYWGAWINEHECPKCRYNDQYGKAKAPEKTDASS